MGCRRVLIMCLLRHLDEADALETLAAAMPYRDQIVGVGLDSGERGNPPRKFEGVFRRAREGGIRGRRPCRRGRAGNLCREALDVLNVVRIDHGNRAWTTRLVAELVRRRIPLTVCPLSNLNSASSTTWHRIRLKRMLELGLVVTVNSDDPAYFGGYVNDNYVAVAEAVGLGEADVVKLARNSFDASLLDEAAKARLLGELEIAVTSLERSADGSKP